MIIKYCQNFYAYMSMRGTGTVIAIINNQVPPCR